MCLCEDLVEAYEASKALPATVSSGADQHKAKAVLGLNWVEPAMQQAAECTQYIARPPQPTPTLHALRRNPCSSPMITVSAC